MKSKRPRWFRIVETIILLGLLAFIVGNLYLKPDALTADVFTGKLLPAEESPRRFEKNIEGVRYVGKTGSFEDDMIYHFGAYEADVLHFLRDAANEEPVDEFPSPPGAGGGGASAAT